MLLADTLGRTVNAPYETPVAATWAMMGLPFSCSSSARGESSFMIHPALRKKQRLILFALLALIVATSVMGIGMGVSSLSYDQLIPTLLGQGSFKETFILYSVRMPRLVVTLGRHGVRFIGCHFTKHHPQ